MEKKANKETVRGFRFFIDLIFGIWSLKKDLWGPNAETAASVEHRVFRLFQPKSNNADFVSKSALLGARARLIYYNGGIVENG